MSSLELPPSNGFTSYKANIGKLENKGFELKVTGYLLRDTERELIWSVTGSLVRNKDKIIKLSEAMKEPEGLLLTKYGRKETLKMRFMPFLRSVSTPATAVNFS